MAVLEILTAPDPRLRLQSKQVTDVASVQTLIDDLLDTLYATDNGIGLAAPQVGREEAIVVIDLSDNRDQPLVLINPKVVSGSNKEMGSRRLPIGARLLRGCGALYFCRGGSAGS